MLIPLVVKLNSSVCVTCILLIRELIQNNQYVCSSKLLYPKIVLLYCVQCSTRGRSHITPYNFLEKVGCLIPQCSTDPVYCTMVVLVFILNYLLCCSTPPVQYSLHFCTILWLILIIKEAIQSSKPNLTSSRASHLH